MNALQRTLQAIGRHLGGLPSTAKLLMASLMVILVMSLFLVALYAGRPSMVPLPIDLDADARSAALAYMERHEIAHEERDGRLLVPPDQKYTVLAELTDGEVISGDQIRFDTLIEQDSPFLTREQNRRRWLIAKMNVLSVLISKFKGVQRATVVIDLPDQRGFGPSFTPPSASVTVTPSGDGLSAGQVEAIAHTVAGAQPGLKASDVQVIDAKNGRRHEPRQDDELSATKNLEIQRAAEKHVEAKIEELLAYIPGVRIAVRAMVDTRQIEQRTDSFEDPKVGPLQESRRTIDSTSQSVGMEPGVRPNTGVALSPTTGRGTRMTDERSDSVTQPKFPRDAQHIMDRKGYALEINASIGVPRSYFVSLYRRSTNDAEASPDDATLLPTVTAETDRIRQAVEPLVDTGAYEDAVPGDVVVSMIPDVATAAALPAAMPPAGGGGFGGDPGGPSIAGNLIKYIGLVGLALLSLAMMFLMVRKAGVQAQLPTADEIVGFPPPLPTDRSEIVGEAEESAPALEGVELDDDALQRKQMLSQISDMVKQNPDEVANLLRRWIKVEA